MSLRMIEACKFAPVSPTQKLVLLVLADCHNDETGRCDPSVAMLMQITGLSNRAIADAFLALEAAGHLTASRVFGSRSCYKLHPSSEPRSRVSRLEPVSEVHGLAENQCSRLTGEPRSPVNLVPKPVNLVPPTSEPRSKTSEPRSLKPEEPERNRKEPERARDWRAEFRSEADRASAIPLPLLWTEPIRKAIAEFFSHRHDLATKAATKTSAKPWTARAANATISQVETALETHGEKGVLIGIQKALASGWQGLHFDNLNTNQNGNGNQHQRRDSGSLNKTGRY